MQPKTLGVTFTQTMSKSLTSSKSGHYLPLNSQLSPQSGLITCCNLRLNLKKAKDETGGISDHRASNLMPESELIMTQSLSAHMTHERGYTDNNRNTGPASNINCFNTSNI